MESKATRGGTRWKRFAVVMVPSVAATAAIGVAMAQGALAASFSVSGQQFRVSADELHGYGFLQYGAVDTQHGGDEKAVAISAFNHATITNLCQSVSFDVPVVGPVTMKLTAGDAGKAVQAKNLYIDLDDLKTKSATFSNINIGVAAGDQTKGPGMNKGSKYEMADKGGFAQEADEAVLTGVHQTAWATNAGTFELSHLGMHVSKGADGQCPAS
ncbi:MULTISPECIES: DUF6230 family protein [Streptomycetaceae]|nr:MULTISPECIES: DUF6230 family protein [Streptomycetaceae]MYS61087.1 cholesterol esterase [Streptomyces sp. SID5468]CCB76928.1 Cholesterol esterase [Streptantibioticus cattleyicolor NRRL 8057 = DSM 46488]